ncbi:MAG: hypothetical protein KBS83_08225 [Lachnospiraceae bacterium]|nr:hypothetical protein [Candidatus Equihabitans merdae]
MIQRIHKVDKDIEGKILTVLAVFFPVSEIIKQILLTVTYGQYQWWYFPFQLCSMPIYFLPLYVCLKNKQGRWGGDWVDGHMKSQLAPLSSSRGQSFSKVLAAYLADFGLLGGIFAFADQSGMHYELPILTVHSYIWHILMVVMALLIWRNETRSFSEPDKFSESGTFSVRNLPGTIALFGLTAAVATCFNLAFHPYGIINMFYISPHYKMTQVVFSDIADLLGDGAGHLIYLISIAVGGCLIHMLLGAASKVSSGICRNRR